MMCNEPLDSALFFPSSCVAEVSMRLITEMMFFLGQSYGKVFLYIKSSSIRLSSFSQDEAVCIVSVWLIIDHYISIIYFFSLLGDSSDLIVLRVISSTEKKYVRMSVFHCTNCSSHDQLLNTHIRMHTSIHTHKKNPDVVWHTRPYHNFITMFPSQVGCRNV